MVENRLTLSGCITIVNRVRDVEMALNMVSNNSSVLARTALTDAGWRHDVRLDIDAAGRIESLTAGVTDAVDNSVIRVDVLLPAMPNLHSHAFQRAMAGLTEARGEDPSDSFWTWRQLMYRFLDRLTPDDVEAITAFAQMEMLEQGFASVGEFHYLHHQSDGTPYTDLAELSVRVIAAAAQTGIGLTLLPVMYEQGGCDGRALEGGQRRFGNRIDAFANLFSDARSLLSQLPADTNIGVAPHSLRAVSQQSLQNAFALADRQPFHIHVAEQVAEVDEILAAWQARPVQWLLDNSNLDETWCLIHATQMQPEETQGLAASGATVGLCPVTESSLGDGIFDGMRYLDAGGNFGVGTDSNIRISTTDELRTLEYSQRLRDRGRAMFANPERSTGRVLFDAALNGGARALQRQCGALAVGNYADMLVLDTNDVNLCAVSDDTLLDAWLFAAGDNPITDVWAAGRHVVKDAQHIDRERILARYRQVLKGLLS